ncbi:regulatory protein NosR [Pseudomonas aeruginosa PA38182]|nr:regulatory protein NosR [Pseudomonas aeruginosa PA38182]
MRALRFSAGSWRCVFAWMLLLVGLAAQGAELSKLERLRIAQVFPAVERIGDPEGDYGVRRLSKGEETLATPSRPSASPTSRLTPASRSTCR